MYKTELLDMEIGEDVYVTDSVCPWNTLTEWMDGSLKSHSLKVVSLDEVTTRRWVGCVQQWVSSWSWPEHTRTHARTQTNTHTM